MCSKFEPCYATVNSAGQGDPVVEGAPRQRDPHSEQETAGRGRSV